MFPGMRPWYAPLCSTGGVSEWFKEPPSPATQAKRAAKTASVFKSGSLRSGRGTLLLAVPEECPSGLRNRF